VCGGSQERSTLSSLLVREHELISVTDLLFGPVWEEAFRRCNSFGIAGHGLVRLDGGNAEQV
jgi:hypothetical protein